MDGPAGRTADNPPESARFGVYHRTGPELKLRVSSQPGLPVWHRFGVDPDLGPKCWSGTVANTKCVHVEIVECFDGWQGTWWHAIHMMPGLLVPSIPQCKMKCHKGGCLESFQAIGHFQPPYIEAELASNMIWKVRSLKLRIKTQSFVENIITSSKKVFIDWESDMVVGIWKLCNTSWETVKSYIIVG